MSADSPRAFAFTVFAFSLVSGGAFGQLFSTPRYPVTAGPYSIAAGDLNGDGKPDLVTSDYFGTSLSVLFSSSALPTGPVGYANGAAYDVGNNPYMVAVADADNDGKLDLISAVYGIDRLSFMKGDGLGFFGAVSLIFPGNGPACVAVADFNGDGLKDLASANFDDSTVSILRGNGSGGFLPAVAFATGAHPNHVLAADFNGDARVDVVTANYDGQSIATLFNNGTGGLGTWTGYAAGVLPFSLASADVDADGDLDLALSCAGSNELRTYRNNGAGALIASQTIPMSSVPTGLAFADVHGDGKTDVILATQGTAPLGVGEVNVFTGNGAGAFAVTPQKYVAGLQTSDVVALDLDQDGDVDVASCNSTSNDVIVHRNLGAGVLAVPPVKTPWPSSLFYPNDLAAADLDGDGDHDLVVSSGFAHSSVSTLKGHGDGHFDAPSLVDVFSEQRGVVLGDLTGNRTLDLVVSRASGSDLLTKLGDGFGGFGAAFTYSGGGAQIGRMAIGDLTSDGKPDLLVAHGASPGLTIHVGNGLGGFLDPPAPLNTTPSIDVQAEDMDGNGYTDLVSSTGTQLDLWFGVGPANFASPAHSQVMTSTGRIAIGDVTGDGRLDAVTGSSSGFVIVVPGAVNFGWNPPGVFPIGPSGTLIPMIADLNGDGRLDVIVAHTASGQEPVGVSVMLGVEFLVLGAPVRFKFGNSPQAITVADVDADGRPDIVMACQNVLASGVSEIVVMRNMLETPQGVVPFGTGTAGTYGRLGMNASSAPKIAGAGFALECTNAPRFALGFMFVGNVANVSGADPFGLGLLLHVDLLASSSVLSLNMQSDPEGIGRTPLPIPNVPAFVGATFHAQTLWIEKSATGQLTSDAALGLVSSKGLSFTILP